MATSDCFLPSHTAVFKAIKNTVAQRDQRTKTEPQFCPDPLCCLFSPAPPFTVNQHVDATCFGRAGVPLPHNSRQDQDSTSGVVIPGPGLPPCAMLWNFFHGFCRALGTGPGTTMGSVTLALPAQQGAGPVKSSLGPGLLLGSFPALQAKTRVCVSASAQHKKVRDTGIRNILLPQWCLWALTLLVQISVSI